MKQIFFVFLIFLFSCQSTKQKNNQDELNDIHLIYINNLKNQISKGCSDSKNVSLNDYVTIGCDKKSISKALANIPMIKDMIVSPFILSSYGFISNKFENKNIYDLNKKYLSKSPFAKIENEIESKNIQRSDYYKAIEDDYEKTQKTNTPYKFFVTNDLTYYKLENGKYDVINNGYIEYQFIKKIGNYYLFSVLSSGGGTGHDNILVSFKYNNDDTISSYKLSLGGDRASGGNFKYLVNKDKISVYSPIQFLDSQSLLKKLSYSRDAKNFFDLIKDLNINFAYCSICYTSIYFVSDYTIDKYDKPLEQNIYVDKKNFGDKSENDYEQKQRLFEILEKFFVQKMDKNPINPNFPLYKLAIKEEDMQKIKDEYLGIDSSK